MKDLPGNPMPKPSRSEKQDADKKQMAKTAGNNPPNGKPASATPPKQSRTERQDAEKDNMRKTAGGNPPDTIHSWQRNAHNFQMGPRGGGQPAVNDAERVAKEGMQHPGNPQTGGDPNNVHARLR